MRIVFSFLAIATIINAEAQTVLNNAFVKAKMETYSESNGNVSAPSSNDIEIYVKDSMSKVSTGAYPKLNSIAIRNMKSNFSVHLSESNAGGKSGFTFSALDQQNQKRKRDSIAKINQETVGSEEGTFRTTLKIGSDVVKNISYVSEQKTINGINCKKAVVTTQEINGADKTVPVWYSPMYIMPKAVGGERGMMNVEGLNGMPIYYETTQTMSVAGNEISVITIYQVTEIKTDVVIADTVFNIPPGYIMKTFSEWEKESGLGRAR